MKRSSSAIARVINGTGERVILDVLGQPVKKLEDSLPSLGPNQKLRTLSPVFKVDFEQSNGCGSWIELEIPHGAISAVRYEELFVYVTDVAGGNPVLLESYSAKKKDWTYDGTTTVKLFRPAAQLFVCGARKRHSTVIMNGEGGIIKGRCGVSLRFPIGLQDAGFAIEEVGDLNKRPQNLASPVIYLDSCAGDPELNEPIIVTLPHCIEGASLSNLLFVFQDESGAIEKQRPFFVDDKMAFVKTTRHSCLCWIEVVDPRMRLFGPLATVRGLFLALSATVCVGSEEATAIATGLGAGLAITTFFAGAPI